MATDLDVNARTEEKVVSNGVNGDGQAAAQKDDSDSLHVLIVGCGIAGLVAAISLKEKGFKVTIVEAATEFSHVSSLVFHFAIRASCPARQMQHQTHRGITQLTTFCTGRRRRPPLSQRLPHHLSSGPARSNGTI